MLNNLNKANEVLLVLRPLIYVRNFSFNMHVVFVLNSFSDVSNIFEPISPVCFIVSRTVNTSASTRYLYDVC